MIGCQGSCTVSRYGWPGAWIPYNRTANLYEPYVGCDWGGHGHCEFWHEFMIHQVPYISAKVTGGRLEGRPPPLPV